MRELVCPFFPNRVFSRRQILLFSMLIVSLSLSGCGTLNGGRHWGEDVTLKPGWDKIINSAKDAVSSPMFYLPAAAALLLQIDHADRRISDWATKHTPVYGSQEKADQRSEDLRSIAANTFYLSMVATPSGDEPVTWVISKAKGALIQQSAVGLNHALVNGMKKVTRRKRPLGDNDLSFPSSRSSIMTVYTSLSAKNIDTMNIPRSVKTAGNIGLYALLIAGSWGRIESGSHYPGDVLAGVSVGYFVSSFIDDSFMGLDRKRSGGPVVMAGLDGMYIGYRLTF